MRHLGIGAGMLIAVVVVGIPWQGGRAESRVPASRAEVQLSFAPLVRKAAPAVVNIYTKRVVRQAQTSPLFNDPLFRQFFGRNFSFGAPRERVQRSLGSGVIVRPDGLVVTNNHVIKDAESITVVLADRREFAAVIVSTDEDTDLAILKIAAEGEKLSHLEIRDSDELEVGDLVLAIGNPFGVGQTVTSGIVSALARTTVGVSDFSFFVQTDAAINPGNSGGALIDLEGRLVGINTAIYSRSGGSIGIGFAIPTNMVSSVIASALEGGPIVRAWLGAAGQGVTAELAASIGLKRPAGVLISQVYATGPSAKAGVKVGDVIVAVNGKPVDDVQALRFRVATLAVGKQATLGILRDGKRKNLQVSLIGPPEVPLRNLAAIEGNNPLSGAEIGNLSPALADELKMGHFLTGVVIIRMKRGSPAHRARLQRGDIIVSINDRKIASVSDVKEAVLESARSWKLGVLRGDKILTREFTQ